MRNIGLDPGHIDNYRMAELLLAADHEGVQQGRTEEEFVLLEELGEHGLQKMKD